MDKYKLSADQLNSALIQYANGKTTSQIIDEIIKKESLEDTKPIRLNLQIQLRSVNPSDKRFATLKYGVLYDLAREAALDVFKERAFESCSSVFFSTSDTLKDLDQIKSMLRDIINEATDIDIKSNAELLNTVKILISIPQIEGDVLNARDNLLNQLSKFINKE